MKSKQSTSYDNLVSHRANVTSQTGENGLIEFLCKTIDCSNRTCIEFGAWDGIHLSNVYPLWHDKGWKALLVEGDPTKYRELRKNVAGFDVTPLCALVGESGDNTLETLARSASFPAKWDVLSIDIDGNDYAVLESIDLRGSSVRIIIVEFNDSIPPHLNIISTGFNYTGSSALSFVRMMKERSYELLCTCGTNLIFVCIRDFDEYFGYDNSLEKIFDYSNISYLMSDYAGNLFCDKLPNQTPAGRGTFALARRMARWLKYPQVKRDLRNGRVIFRGLQVFGDSACVERLGRGLDTEKE